MIIFILKWEKLKRLTSSLKIIEKKKMNKKNNNPPLWYNENIKIGTKNITDNIRLANSILNNNLKFIKILLSTIVSVSLAIAK